MCFVVTCWERADLLALVCGVFCEFVTFPLVSWVRCGTWLYRFLIFATLLLFLSSFCSRGYMVWKMLIEEFQDGCLVHGHLWYVNRVILAILSIYVAWGIPSRFCSKVYMGWKRCCLKITIWLISFWSSLISEWNDFTYSESQEGIKFWRCCLKNSKKAVKCMAILGIRV